VILRLPLCVRRGRGCASRIRDAIKGLQAYATPKVRVCGAARQAGDELRSGGLNSKRRPSRQPAVRAGATVSSGGETWWVSEPSDKFRGKSHPWVWARVADPRAGYRFPGKEKPWGHVMIAGSEAA